MYGVVCLSERLMYEKAVAGAMGWPEDSARQVDAAVWYSGL